jgi:hypothetical protein
LRPSRFVQNGIISTTSQYYSPVSAHLLGVQPMRFLGRVLQLYPAPCKALSHCNLVSAPCKALSYCNPASVHLRGV